MRRPDRPRRQGRLRASNSASATTSSSASRRRWPEDRLDDPQRAGRPRPPGRQVAELPPPQRLVGAAGLEVVQPVVQRRGDLGQVAGQRAVHHAARARSGRRSRRSRRCPRARWPGRRAAGRRPAPGRGRARTGTAARRRRSPRAGRRRAAPGRRASSSTDSAVDGVGPRRRRRSPRPGRPGPRRRCPAPARTGRRRAGGPVQRSVPGAIGAVRHRAVSCLRTPGRG